MTANVTKEGNRFSISVEDYGKAKLAVSGDELTIIYLSLKDWFKGSDQEKSERKSLLKRVSYLESWKKHTIADEQRFRSALDKWQVTSADHSADLVQRVTAFEGGLEDVYTILKDTSETVELLHKRIKYLEEGHNPSGNNVALEKQVDNTKRYLAGEIDNVVEYTNKLSERVSELERLDGLNQLFIGQQNTRIGLVETASDRTKTSLADIRGAMHDIVSEQHKHEIDIKHLNRRLREVEAKHVSTEIKIEPLPKPRKGMVAETITGQTIRDENGRFMKSTKSKR